MATTFVVLLVQQYAADMLPLAYLLSPFQYPERLAAADSRSRNELHYSKYRFLWARHIEHSAGSAEAFAQMPLPEQCRLFFEVVDAQQPDWRLDPLKGEVFDKGVSSEGEYFRSKAAKLQAKEKATGPVQPDTAKKILAEFAHLRAKSNETAIRMADTATILRVFGRCFFSRDTPLPLTGDLAETYRRYAEKVASPIPRPRLDADGKSPLYPDAKLAENFDLLQTSYENLSGQGIVLTVASRHMGDVVKLINLLRALGNTLPIQIYTRDVALERMKKAVQRMATASKEALLSGTMSDQGVLNRAMKRLGLEITDLQRLDFPVQHITMIDLYQGLESQQRNDFASYRNKILALWASSFEQVMLLDADTVPLMAPQTLMQLQEFTSTGAYFFKDRSLVDQNDWIETNYFAQLMPHAHSSIDVAMGIRPVSRKTMQNEYMRGWRHCQEAGMVLFDKRRHFTALLMLFPLALWDQPVRSLIWGDKEMYWLAMSLAGDEDYTFNELGAASVGQITVDPNKKYYNTSAVMELCLSHPGHVDGNGRLLWFNSGFSFCKMNGPMRDKQAFPFTTFANVNEVKALYENPLIIRDAIVPPPLPSLRSPTGSSDLTEQTKFRKRLESRKKDVDSLPRNLRITTYGPQKGWVKSSLCLNYQYCAYSSHESFTNPLEQVQGLVFHFDRKDALVYDILGAIWKATLRAQSVQEVKKATPEDSENTISLMELVSQISGEEDYNPWADNSKPKPKAPASEAKPATDKDTTKDTQDSSEPEAEQPKDNKAPKATNKSKGKSASEKDVVHGALEDEKSPDKPSEKQPSEAGPADQPPTESSPAAKDSLDGLLKASKAEDPRLVNRPGRASSKASKAADYDPSEARNRPEKLKSDLKAVLGRMKSKQGSSNSE